MSDWLIDKSALVRLSAIVDVDVWTSRLERGVVRISSLTRLEVGYSARSATDLRAAIDAAPLAWMPTEYLTPAIEDRGIEVQLLLAGRGEHRAPSIPDLLIAATAELAGLTLLHFDEDFELIAAVTGQATERLKG